MKTNFFILAILIVSILNTRAQGVIHLGSGDSYLFSRPTITGGQIDESGAMYLQVRFGFTGDLFDLGDSLRLDILSAPTSVTPLVTTVISNTASNPPWISPNGIGFEQSGIIWNAQSGVVRLTMLSGGVDISGASAITINHFSEIHYSYTIPEPGSSSLLLVCGAVFGGVRWIGERKRRTPKL